MPLPAGVETVTVSSGEPLTLPDGTLMEGRLIFTGPDMVTIGEDDLILGGTVEVPLTGGEFTVTLVATDATGMDPTGWTYQVRAALTNAPSWKRHITLPKATPAVVLADILVPDPVQGEFAVLVDGSTLLAKAANLADLPSASTARQNLGLGGAATLAVGTAAGTVAAGDDARITGAAQKTQNLADLANASTARTNLGLGGAAILDVGSAPGTVAAGNDSRLSDARPPTAHAASHASGGTDPLTPAQIGALTQALADVRYLLQTGGTLTGGLTVNTAAEANALLALHVGAETFDRVRVATDRVEVGSGSAARDTNWRRSAANEWTTDDAVIVSLMLRHLGTTLGFYGATATTKPAVTGSRGGNAALASLITALATLGLITDSTTA